jgi:hypothetical protein
MSSPTFCWHCRSALAVVGGNLVFEIVYVQGAYRTVHRSCAETLEEDNTLVTPHIFPEGPDFYKSYD